MRGLRSNPRMGQKNGILVAYKQNRDDVNQILQWVSKASGICQRYTCMAIFLCPKSCIIYTFHEF